MMHAVPITLAEAKAFVAAHHRHHKPPLGHIFCVACAVDNGPVCGVAVVGRPVARMSCDGWTAEVIRVAGSWHREARPRIDTHPTQVKLKWEVTL